MKSVELYSIAVGKTAKELGDYLDPKQSEKTIRERFDGLSEWTEEEKKQLLKLFQTYLANDITEEEAFNPKPI